jgi:hypothetical protein
VRRALEEQGPRHEILLALCCAGLVLFNFPMLILWDRDSTVFGLPSLPVALFAIWAALIGVLAWASERWADRGGANDDAGPSDPSPHD